MIMQLHKYNSDAKLVIDPEVQKSRLVVIKS